MQSTKIRQKQNPKPKTTKFWGPTKNLKTANKMSPTRPHKKLKIERQNIFLSAPQKIKKCGFTSTKRQKTKICEQLCFAISKILRGLWWVENTGRNISGPVPPRLHYGTPRYIRTFQKCRVQPFCHQAAGNPTTKIHFCLRILAV